MNDEWNFICSIQIQFNSKVEYFNELQSKIFGLHQKVNEETLVNGQLQNLVHTLHGM